MANDRYLYVCDTMNNRLVKRDADTLAYVNSWSTLTYGFRPYGAFVHGGYLYLVCRWNTTPDWSWALLKIEIATMTVVGSHTSGYYDYDPGNGKMAAPHQPFADGTNIFIAEAGWDKIIKLDANCGWVADFGTSGSGDNQFNVLRGICGVGTNLVCSDKFNYRLKKHAKSDLSFVSKIGSFGNPPGTDQFTGPWMNCSDGTYLYLCDCGDATNQDGVVKRLASDLSAVARVQGSPGSGDNQFDNPAGICTDGTWIWVMEQTNHRINKRLCSDLSFVAKIGSYGSGQDQFNYPWGIAFSDESPPAPPGPVPPVIPPPIKHPMPTYPDFAALGAWKVRQWKFNDKRFDLTLEDLRGQLK